MFTFVGAGLRTTCSVIDMLAQALRAQQLG